MSWYKKAQEDHVSLYHATTQEAAGFILKNGFEPNKRHFFTTKKNAKMWMNILKTERSDNPKWKNPVIIEIVVSNPFHKNEFWNWDEDEFTGLTHPGQLSYGEGKLGWNVPDWNRPALKNGVNCNMRILTEKEINELV